MPLKRDRKADISLYKRSGRVRMEIVLMTLDHQGKFHGGHPTRRRSSAKPSVI